MLLSRRWLYLLLALAFCVAVAACSTTIGNQKTEDGSTMKAAQARGATGGKPNVVFVLTDDQHISTIQDMPALQNQVKAQGLTFNNMVATEPLCCPQRATLFTGMYPHNTHVLKNDTPNGGYETFKDQALPSKSYFVNADNQGYSTGLFGKYLNNYQDCNKPVGVDRIAAFNGPKEGWSSYNDQQSCGAIDRSTGDTLVARDALNFIKVRSQNHTPFLASVNFGAPHSPYYRADQDADFCTEAGVPRNASINEDDVSDKPSWVKNLSDGDAGWRDSTGQLTQAGMDQVDSEYRQSCDSLGRVDRFIRDTQTALANNGEWSDTYFIFYTDNANHFGEHRLLPGKQTPYESDENFPLIIKGPGIPQGATTNKLVGAHDVNPTIVRMVGGVPGSWVDGRSLLSLAQSPDSTSWARKSILVEKRTGTNIAPDFKALRMQNSIYVRYLDTGDREYYDLTTDPLELNNQNDTLADDKRTAYGNKIDDLFGCSGDQCTTAENEPLP